MEPIIFVIPDMIDFSLSMRVRAIGRFNNHIPLGVLSLMTLLDRDGYDVVLYDNYILQLTNDELIEKIINENTTSSVICFSINCLNIFNVKFIASKLKKMNSEFTLIAGGPHVTLCLDDCKPFFDYYIQGEGESALSGLIHNINYNGGWSDEVIRANRIKNLDKLPIVDRKFLNINDYDRKTTLLLDYKVDNMLSSRGCPYDCSFCNTPELWERKFYSVSPEKLIDEIKLLIEIYGTESIYFRDDNFVVDRKRVMKFCQLIKDEGINIPFQTYARIDLMDDELLNAMREAGFISLFFGIESGCDITLRYINKKFTKELVREKFKLLKKHDFKVSTGFLFGFPYEKYSEIDETIDFIEEIKPDWSFFQMVVAFPTSKMYHECLRQGLVREHVGKFFTIQPKYLNFEYLVELENKYEGMFNELRYSDKEVYSKT